MFSIRNRSLPIGFQNIFTLNIQIHNYNTKSSKLFRMHRTRVKICQFSIKYQGPKFFKSLASEFKEIHSLYILNVLKNLLKLYLVSTYSYN